jgi:hypothetical protein
MTRSHIIPQFYLKQFAFKKPNGKHYVYLYERGKEPADRYTKNVGYEPGYFGYVLPDGTLEESLEEKLAVMERDAMDALVSANSDLFVFTHSNRSKLAFYAGLLHARTTQRLEWNKQNWLNIYEQLDGAMKEGAFTDELTRYFSFKMKTTLSREWVRYHIKELIQQNATTEQGKNNFLDNLIFNANDICGQLSSKKARIWKSPKGLQLVTSDNPLVSFVVVGNGEFAPGFGFRRKETVAFLPISPNKCLVFGGDDPREHFEISADTLRKLNWAMISSSHHYVYAKTVDADVQALAQDLIGRYLFGVTAFIPDKPLPNVKDFVRSHLGIVS